jgi:two-component system chemotaxis response regulator CheB
MNTRPKLRVLVVDDSALVRRALSEAITAAGDMEVAGTACDPFDAREKLLALEPDVMTLDLEMPRMGGLSFLRQLMQHHPLPVIVISSLTGPSCEASIEALRLGAVDVMAKPCGSYSVGRIREDLPEKLRAAARVRPFLRKRPMAVEESSPAELAVRPPATMTAIRPGETLGERVRLASSYRPGSAPHLIAMGASTGGTEALAAILEALPVELPGIVITQHIPAGFSLAFAQRLNRTCALEVKEAVNGDVILPGQALVAPGNFHMVVRRVGNRLSVDVVDGPQVCYQRPSVDVLFQSVAKAVGSAATGILLTGMGTDGANGLLAMRQQGARTLVQDERSSVVFGMPKEAIRLGAAERVLGLGSMAAALIEAAEASAAGRPHS